MKTHTPKTPWFAALAGGFSLLALAGSAQDLVTNGGFEEEPNWGNTQVYYDGSATAMLGNEIPGWTIEPDHAATIHFAGGTYDYLVISGNYSLNTDGEGYDGHNANLYQDFATGTNANYVLSFNWQSWGIFGDDAPGTQLEISLTDDVTGNTIFDGLYSYDGPEDPGPNGPLHLVTTNFQGTGDLVRLRIQQSPESGINDDMFVVDNFSVIGSGSLQVTLVPPCAVTNGAQWQVDGGPWQSSGAVVTNLAVVTPHTVSFSDVTGWVTPSNQIVFIATLTNNLIAAYTVPGTITWINLSGVNSDWSTPANWDRNRAPTNGDVVVIPNTGGNICTLDTSATVAGLIIGGCDGYSDGLELNGNSLTVNGPITVSNTAAFTIGPGTLVGTENTIIYGAVGWTNGALQGIFTLDTNSALTLAGQNQNLYLTNCILTNYGTVLWTNGYPDGGGSAPGTVIYNYGLWNCQTDWKFKDDGGGSNVVFNNYGTFLKSRGTNTSATTFPNGVVFNQWAGQVDPRQGNLLLQGGGVFTGGAVTNDNGVLTFGGGNFTLNGTTTATNAATDVYATGGNLYETGGNLVGNNVINGGLVWQGGGNWNSATSVTILTNSSVSLAGNGNSTGNNLYFYSCTVTNYGTVLWTNGYPDGGGVPGTVIYNYGLWNCQSDYQFKNDGNGGGTIFNNYGIFRKSAGSNTSSTFFPSGVVFDQLAGQLDLQQGYLLLGGGGNFLGGTATNNGGILTFSGGTFVLDGTATGNKVFETGGNLVGNTLINGALTWQGGNWNGAPIATILAGSTLTLAGNGNSSGNNLYFYNCTLANYGTVLWTNGYPDGGGSAPGTIVNNYGLWNCQSDWNFKDDGGGNNVVFNNYGTFRKSAGTNTSQTTVPNGVMFNQYAGVVDLQQGNLLLQGGGAFTGGTATNNHGVLTFSSGNFTLNGTDTGTNVYETGGNLVGNTVINGGLIWQGGGNWNNTTSVLISAGSTLTLAGSGNSSGNNLYFYNCTLANYGTVLWTNGYPDGGGSALGTIVENYGLWNCLSDWNFKDDGGGSNVVFDNYAAFRKSGGTNTSQTTFVNGVAFNQLAGQLDLRQGNLLLQGGGSFIGGTATNNNGVLTFSGGNFTLNGTATGNNVYETGGNLAGNTVISGGLVWQGGGNWNNTTSVVISAGSTLTLAGSGNSSGNNLYFYNCTLTNYGTVLWTNGYPDGGGSALGTIVENYGLWNCLSDWNFRDDGGGDNVVFNNYATFRKSGGTNTSQTTFVNGVAFNQLAGQLDLQQGNLLLQGGGNFTGGTATDNNGVLTFSSGNFTLNGTATGNNVYETGGNLEGNTVVNGGLVWQGGGNWNNATSVVISAGSTVTVAGGGNNLYLYNCTVTNYGTVLWTNGYPDGGGSTTGTIIDNYGLWLCQSNYNLKDDGGGKNTLFNNYGTFRKTGTSGGSSVLQTGVTFNNLGKLDSQLGAISLQGAYSLAGGRLNFGLNSLASYGTITLAGAAALTGAVSANLNNGFIPATGNSFPILSYGSKSGSFSSTVLPLGFIWTTNYGSTTYTISVASPLPPGAVTNLAAQWQSGQAALQFSGAANASYTVLATTDLTVPTTNWIPLGQASQPTSGSFQYLDSQSSSFPQRFYLIRSP